MNLSHYQQTPLAQFENTLIRLLRPFPVIRFMNWQQINRNSPTERPLVRDWADLPSENEKWDYTGGDWSAFRGVPLSRIIRIANLTNAQPWICIPIAASNKLIAEMVAFCIERSTHRPIFEFANEIWNRTFWQHTYASEKGLAQGLSTDPITAGLLWQVQRTKLIRAAAGNSAEVVIAAQFFNPSVAETLIKHIGNQVDALAVAPYLGRNQASLHNGQARPLAEIHAEISQEINGSVQSLIGRYRQLSHRYGVDLYAYEGGLHQVARNWDNATSSRLKATHFSLAKNTFLNYNRSPFAGDNINHLWRVWQSNGGSTFCPYSLATTFVNIWNDDMQNQFFGHSEVLGTQIQLLPKYRAALASINGASPVKQATNPEPVPAYNRPK